MKRKIAAIALAIVMVATLASCGKKGIEGTWKYVSGDTAVTDGIKVPYSLTFQKGKLAIDVDFNSAGLSESDAAFARQMTSLADIKYEVLSDKEVRISVSLASIGYSEVKSYSYQVSDDTLVLDGATFKRQ